MKPEEHDSVKIIDSLQVAKIAGEGLCIVDEAGHYWRVVRDSRMQEEDDKLAETYRRVEQ